MFSRIFNISQLKKRTNFLFIFLLIQKGFFPVLSIWKKLKQILRIIWWKKFGDSSPENSSKHAMSSIKIDINIYLVNSINIDHAHHGAKDFSLICFHFRSHVTEDSGTNEITVGIFFYLEKNIKWNINTNLSLTHW